MLEEEHNLFAFLPKGFCQTLKGTHSLQPQYHMPDFFILSTLLQLSCSQTFLLTTFHTLPTVYRRIINRNIAVVCEKLLFDM